MLHGVLYSSGLNRVGSILTSLYSNVVVRSTASSTVIEIFSLHYIKLKKKEKIMLLALIFKMKHAFNYL